MLTRRKQLGVSLIEVLIAIVIFSVGVLGVALMQMKGAQLSKQASARTQIVLETRSLIDAMRANPAAVQQPRLSGNPASPSAAQCPYCITAGAAVPNEIDCSSSCTIQQIASNDIAHWLGRIKKVAPASLGTSSSIAWNASLGTYVVTARWSGGAISGDPTATTSSDDLSYTLSYLP